MTAAKAVSVTYDTHYCYDPLSGKRYKIHCPDSQVMDTSDWLLNELREFRKSGEG